MEIKFTKGKWIASGTSVMVMQMFDDDKLRAIFTLTINDYLNTPKDEFEYNAKLIASAPDMFYQLIRCRNLLKNKLPNDFEALVEYSLIGDIIEQITT